MSATQNTRVLAALTRAGDQGLTQDDWLHPGGADGAGRITRLGARIKDLRDEGFPIASDGTRDGFTVYKLVERQPAGGVRADSVAAADEPPTSLFEVPANKPDTSPGRASVRAAHASAPRTAPPTRHAGGRHE